MEIIQSKNNIELKQLKIHITSKERVKGLKNEKQLQNFNYYCINNAVGYYAF